MARLTADDLYQAALDAGYESPRIVPRKPLSGNLVLVLKHGPSDNRSELVFDRNATIPGVKQRLMDEKAA
jgi:hypothetical protein